MSGQVILHMGLHKTGSTSIQASCGHNAALLAQHDIYFPQLARAGGGLRSNHSVPLFSLFCAEPESYQRNIMGEVDVAAANAVSSRELDEALGSPHKTVLLSGEVLAMLEEPGMQALRQRIEDAGRTVRPVVFLRWADAYLCSSCAQRAKGGLNLHLEKAMGRVQSQVETLRKVLPETEFYSFEALCRDHGGPVEGMLHILGLPADSGFEVLRRNEGNSNHATRIVSFINWRYPSVVDKQKSPLREAGDTAPLFTIPGEKYCYDSSEFSRIGELLEAENQWMRENFGKDFVPPALMEPRDCLWGPEQLEALQEAMPQLPAHLAEAAGDYLIHEARLDPAIREEVHALLECDYESLRQYRERIAEHVDVLRDLAVSLEDIDVQRAYNLMEIARLGRPGGRFIKNRLERYRRKLERPR